jgi:hypothetical protein
MKQHIYLIFFFALCFGARRAEATPYLPYLSEVRTQLTVQIAIASNTVPVDSKLQGALQKSLSLIDKADTPSLANDLKVLGALATAISKTSISTVFQGSLDKAVNDYFDLVYGMTNTSAAKLATAYPSKAKDSTQKSLTKLYATLGSADIDGNFGVAAKLIGKALSQLASTEKLLASALKVAAPPSGVNGTITGSSNWNFKSTLAVAVTGSPTNNVTVNSSEVILKAPFGQRTLTFSMYGLQEGANTLTVGLNDFLIVEVYGNGTGGAYNDSSGTIQVNYNSTTKTVVGTFNVTLRDEDTGGKVINVVGDFSASIQ